MDYDENYRPYCLPEWQEGINRMSKQLSNSIDEEIMEMIIEEDRMLRIPQSKLCTNCKDGVMGLFGVTESGAYKYICGNCFHKTEYFMFEVGEETYHQNFKLDTAMKKLREKFHK